MALIEKIEKLPDTNRCQCGHANAIHYLDSDTDKFYCNYPRCGCAGYEKQQPNFDHVRDIYDLLCIHSTYRKACDGCSTREFINRAVADKTIRLSAQLKASQDEARRYRKALERIENSKVIGDGYQYIAHLRELAREALFMVKNGLGDEDMIDDTRRDGCR